LQEAGLRSRQSGVPVATHEIYPAAFIGVDNTEHTGATSRRGYSPKVATLSRTYDDVIQIFGKSERYLTPTLFAGGGVQKLFADEPDLRTDPRFSLYPAWLRRQIGRGLLPWRETPPAATKW
jgi:hypothetical protein